MSFGLAQRADRYPRHGNRKGGNAPPHTQAEITHAFVNTRKRIPRRSACAAASRAALERSRAPGLHYNVFPEVRDV